MMDTLTNPAMPLLSAMDLVLFPYNPIQSFAVEITCEAFKTLAGIHNINYVYVCFNSM
jgi:hypothetical protein